MSSESKKGLSIRNISKDFGNVQALINVDLEIQAGEFFTLLGPSGCGKTTLLRIIAGLELTDRGEVFLGGENITSLAAARRHVNTVFQNYALFPHLTIYENIAFGLRARKIADARVRERVVNHLEMLGLKDMADRHPHQLSGGQKQRVALARALVNEPEVLLLDEPMSALDARLRAHLQVELRRLQQTMGKTFILVTHDQDEALVVSDRLAVMNNGRIIQHGTPRDVYEEPKTRFVAEFLGAANLIHGKFRKNGVETEYGFLYVEDIPSTEEVTLAIRPEWIYIRDDKPKRNGIYGKIREAIYRGNNIDLWVDPGPIRVRTDTRRHFGLNEQIWLELAPEELVVLDEE